MGMIADKPLGQSAGNDAHKWCYFNIHNLVRMRVTVSHVCAYSIKSSYEPFRCDYLDDCNLTLSETMLLGDTYTCGSTVYGFSGCCTRLMPYAVDVALEGQKLMLAGKRDLLPFVSPLIHWLMLTQGATTIHGAGVSINECGVLMPAWGGTGKTSAIVELLKLPASAFMADDYTILCEDGRLLSYPKPFFIYPYHYNIFPHLFKNKPKFLVPEFMSGCTAAVRQAVRPLLSRLPRIESLCRRITPEHMKIPAKKALPDAEFATEAAVKIVLFLERYNGGTVIIEPLDPIVARHRAIGNHYFESGAYAQMLMTGCGATGLLGMEDWFGRMSSIIDKVFGRVPIYCLRMPPMNSVLTGKAVASAVQELLAGC